MWAPCFQFGTRRYIDIAEDICCISNLERCALQEFLLAYDSRPARIASDRWWAAVILAQTFIITYFNMLDPIPDHVQLAITAQGAGALLVSCGLV